MQSEKEMKSRGYAMIRFTYFNQAQNYPHLIKFHRGDVTMWRSVKWPGMVVTVANTDVTLLCNLN